MIMLGAETREKWKIKVKGIKWIIQPIEYSWLKVVEIEKYVSDSTMI